MQRFFCPPENIHKNKAVILDPGEIHHLLDVLRLRKDDEITVFDGENKEYLGLIESVSSKGVSVKIMKIKKSPLDESNITLACAIPKKAKMDNIVEKATELGVSRIMPMITERTIVKLDLAKKDLRQTRWMKIAFSAAKQSQRMNLPTIEPIQEFREVLKEVKNYDLALIPNLEGKRKPLKEVLDINKTAKRILIFIGPEGDFTPKEIDSALKEGVIAVSLGELVLRVETAALAVVGFIKFYYENS